MLLQPGLARCEIISNGDVLKCEEKGLCNVDARRHRQQSHLAGYKQQIHPYGLIRLRCKQAILCLDSWQLAAIGFCACPSLDHMVDNFAALLCLLFEGAQVHSMLMRPVPQWKAIIVRLTVRVSC